ncbi:MAG: RIP metalloprotease RseP [Oligoflexia bacterium]|nr:RIP metalloprotease RseP [Bdellovibrionales bacterium]MYE07634.1 RIP metalloprotease RseP [Oligoflexia bacterium]
MSVLSSVFFSIGGFVSALIPFIVLLGVLIFIHELGHFMVARWCGVKVEVFSLGFGKKLLKWKRKDTLYCVSLFPLGGYVKMFGHEYGKEVAEKDRPIAFLHKKLWQRVAIVLAGPLMNFFLAVLIFAGLNIFVGEKRAFPVIGELAPSSVAAQSGLAYGDLILSIDDVPVKNIREVREIIFEKPDTLLDIKVQNLSQQVQTKKVLSQTGPATGKWGFLEKGGVIEGLTFFAAAAVLGVSDPNSPAGQAGLKTFDKVISVDGKKINTRKELFHILNSTPSSVSSWTLEIQREKDLKTIVLSRPQNDPEGEEAHHLGLIRSDLFIADLKTNGVAEKAGIKQGDFIFKLNGERLPSWSFLVEKIKNFKEQDGALEMEIKRQGQVKSFSLVPEIRKQMINGVEKKSYMLGIIAQSPLIPVGETYVEKSKNPVKALTFGVGKGLHWCAFLFVYIKKLVAGDISTKTLGGAITIGRAAYDSYSYGLEYFFRLMAILSVQLFLFNILPIPVFDGGHLLFYVIEFFNGAPLSIKKMIIAQQMGVLAVLFLLLFTTFNDLHNWLFTW